MPRSINQYTSGRIKLDECMTLTMPLEEINTAFDKMHEDQVIRSVITF